MVPHWDGTRQVVFPLFGLYPAKHAARVSFDLITIYYKSVGLNYLFQQNKNEYLQYE